MEAKQSMYYAGTAWWTTKKIMPYYLIYLGGGSLKTTWKLFHLWSTPTPQVEAFSNKIYLYPKVAYSSTGPKENACDLRWSYSCEQRYSWAEQERLLVKIVERLGRRWTLCPDEKNVLHRFVFQMQIWYVSLARCLLKLACKRLEASMTQWREQRVEFNFELCTSYWMN